MLRLVQHGVLVLGVAASTEGLLCAAGCQRCPRNALLPACQATEATRCTLVVRGASSGTSPLDHVDGVAAAPPGRLIWADDLLRIRASQRCGVCHFPASRLGCVSHCWICPFALERPSHDLRACALLLEGGQKRAVSACRRPMLLKLTVESIKRQATQAGDHNENMHVRATDS